VSGPAGAPVHCNRTLPLFDMSDDLKPVVH